MDVEVAVPPADWDIVGSPSAIVYGERWLREQRSLVLAVPSVILRSETNFVINPRHPRFPSMIVSSALEPFVYDHRLLRG